MHNSAAARPSRMRAFLEEQRDQKGAEAPLTRFTIIALLLFLCFCFIGARLFWIMALSQTKTHTSTPLASPLKRGDILDRNGIILATNLITFSLFANPKNISDPRLIAKKLSSIFPELSEKKIYQKLSSPSPFVWIKRNLTPKQKLSVQYLGQDGLDFQKEQKRVYPHEKLMAHVVGYTNVDNQGLSGIERQFETALKTTEAPVTLSIDVRVQHILREALIKGMREFSAKKASGIIMDAKTSEILGMVSLPDFDPHRPKTSEAIFNTNTLGVYEMGSIFKIFTFAMGLDHRLISLRQGFDASKPIRFGRFTIRDFHAKNRWLSVPEIFMYSSNIGTVKIALKVGADRQKKFFEKLGFLKPLKTELGENGIPMAPRNWKDINVATISYGYGMAISPLQLVSGVATMVNGGVLRAPTFLKKEKGKDSYTRIISAATSEKIRRLMHLVVKNGSGKRSDAQGYIVGGKTGSANKKIEGSKGYAKKNKHRSIFMGAFPMTDPRYLVFIMLDEPKGTKKTWGLSTGGITSAPIAKEVIEKAAPILGVMPVDESSPRIRSAMRINTRGPHAIQ
ncbi:penicillin-binding protein 2 [Alphaproteobacteria bacterium]|nr:penicillin-binding protein 2 [Alphaproteobacteria bacterium]